MVQPWIFHYGFLPRNAFSQIEVLMDDGFNSILLVGNSARSGQVIHEIFLDSKESFFLVYFEFDLTPINEYGFRPQRSKVGLG